MTRHTFENLPLLRKPTVSHESAAICLIKMEKCNLQKHLGFNRTRTDIWAAQLQQDNQWPCKLKYRRISMQSRKEEESLPWQDKCRYFSVQESCRSFSPYFLHSELLGILFLFKQQNILWPYGTLFVTSCVCGSFIISVWLQQCSNSKVLSYLTHTHTHAAASAPRRWRCLQFHLQGYDGLSAQVFTRIFPRQVILLPWVCFLVCNSPPPRPPAFSTSEGFIS